MERGSGSFSINHCVCHNIPNEFCNKDLNDRIYAYFNSANIKSSKLVIPIHLEDNLRTTHNSKFVLKVKNLLEKITKDKNMEYVIGMISNNASVYSYLLIPKKQLDEELKTLSKSYPRLNMIYYDLKWFNIKTDYNSSN